MSCMNTHMMNAHQRAYDMADARAEADEERQSERADSYRQAFAELVMTRNVDAETGMKYMPKLIDVVAEAGCEDESVLRAMLQGLLHCVAKGQAEAITAMEKVGDFFVTKRLED
ncbi:hypothetical protein B9Z51_08800 [Limnohabitans sp. T6-5]|uniref:hypothetical protein n=1 Tax=Limnohabitans sp. T6-5 TaxID=1100724 RepID=UPI000D36B4B0|nr:hypothetical protein [Limnohabitans sp. T6-5]PUE09019.1 hypothetical protein B9Z51_08800 [Limnohabitans sp. T6-5]